MQASAVPLALNINFDSLGEALGHPEGFRDPSFFKVFDRIANIVAKRNIKLSLYMIGRDLENPEVAARIREWAEAGHEIGNHSWDHHMNLGALPTETIQSQIVRTHDLITNITGKAPRGFIAPAWNTSPKVLATLIDLEYLYDTSLFCSYFLYPVFFKIALNHLGTKRFWRTISRKDWLYPLYKPKQAFVSNQYYKPAKPTEKSILVLPLPTRSRCHLPYWHTVGFMFGWQRAQSMVKKLLATQQPFYYLMHPADFAVSSDINGQTHSLERLDISLETKLDNLEKMLSIMEETQRPFVTMEALAHFILETNTSINQQHVNQ